MSRRRAGRLAVLALMIAMSPGQAAASSPSGTADAETTTRRAAVDREIAHWTRRTATQPAHAAAWTSLGDAFVQKARESADPSYYRRAEAAYQRTLELAPRHVAALVGMGLVQGALHEFEQSVTWAKSALAIDPDHAAAHGLLGDAALEMGEHDAAFEHYQRMLDLRPDLASYSRAAHLLWITGNPRKAIRMMGRAADAGAPYAENVAWARVQLALMHLSQGALLPAEQILAGALAAAPQSHHALAATARVKAARKDYAEAVRYYKRAIAVVPHVETLAALGDLHALLGEKEEADKQYTLVEAIHRLHRATGVRPDAQMAKFAADHHRDVGRAIADAEALAATRRSVYAFDALAWCYYRSGRYEEARRAIGKALAMRTPDAEILFHAGMIHARLGDRVAAQKLLYEALSVNPYFHPIHAGTAAATLAELGGGSSR